MTTAKKPKPKPLPKCPLCGREPTVWESTVQDGWCVGCIDTTSTNPMHSFWVRGESTAKAEALWRKLAGSKP